MESLLSNFASPVVLAFALGIAAKLLKSDLEIPKPLYQGLSIYLLLAIGLKGGVELSKTSIDAFIGPASITLLLGVITPLIAYLILRYLGRMDMINSSANCAHYGSVSAVTFIAAISYVESLGYAARKALCQPWLPY